jgi:predicted membrane protein
MDVSSATHAQSGPGYEARPPRFTGRLVAGLAIIVVGVIFLLDALDVPGMGDIWRMLRRAWPAIFIAVGLAKLAGARYNPERVGGAIWILIGTVLLANNYDLISFNIWRMFWPTLIILFGASLLTRAFSRSYVHRAGRGSAVSSGPVDAGSRTSAFAIMSGATRRVSSPDFQGGDATAIMGGCEIDLRQCNIITGPAVFDAFALMGGIDIFVPGDWTIQNEGMALLGAIDDSRKETAGNPSKVLIIRGAALMGGVEIKN